MKKYKQQIITNSLKEKRKVLGLRQKDVARLLGIEESTQRISHWEKGKAMPNVINLFKLCSIYEVHPHEVYPGLVGISE